QLTLPLYTPLVQTIVQDPAKSGQPIEQFIDWWQGGNIIIYAVPTDTGYPDALAAHWSEDLKPELKRAGNPIRNAPPAAASTAPASPASAGSRSSYSNTR